MSPGDIVPLAFHESVVALSFVVAALGSYVALLAATRIRAAGREGAHMGYVAVAAFAMGGVGIWSMHFIGMQAQRLPFIVGYQAGWTALSLAVAVVFSGAAFWYVGRSAFTLGRCVAGGILAGLGVAGMHYLGMAAMRMPGTVSYVPGMVAASVVVAIVAATAALWLAFNIQNEWQRPIAALVMALAVCGMHYTAAAGGLVICIAPGEAASWTIGGASLPYVVFILSALALLAIRWQLHRTSTQYRAHLAARVDALIDNNGSSLASLPRRPGPP
ncbi:MHYT domain-containing protein [Achromobacter aloeverae]|uniref:Signal protein n=1 Tax=Achromobacter aloeverae TaxID=1750518 RepID=A0A4Q1HQ68_9BURK|nr:MHYT domain-containing protein [Achromobacter aloeverae]RXN93222.1 signal protein [Achromobacter aloeverae]